MADISPGTVFGRLTVLGSASPRPGSKGARKYLVCKCVCGTVKEVREDALKEKTRSCGCLTKEVAAAKAKLPMSEGGHVTHGLTNSGAYKVWCGMKERCLVPTHPTYEHYGAKGVTLDERWLSFESFHADMGDRPPNHTLDRKDNTKGYSKDNCRWATKEEQMNNRSNSLRYEYRGRLLQASELALLSGISKTTILQRLSKLHWTVEDAVHKPLFSKPQLKLSVPAAVKLYKQPDDTNDQD